MIEIIQSTTGNLLGPGIVIGFLVGFFTESAIRVAARREVRARRDR